MRTLYNLTEDYQCLLDMMQDPDVDPQAIADTLEGIQGEMEVKADYLITVSKELEAQAAKWEAEEARAKKHKDTAKGNARRIKESVLLAMQTTGKAKMPTEHYKLSIDKNGGDAPLVITGKVPLEFCKHEPDNKKIRARLREGELDWAELGERGVHLGVR